MSRKLVTCPKCNTDQHIYRGVIPKHTDPHTPHDPSVMDPRKPGYLDSLTGKIRQAPCDGAGLTYGQAMMANAQARARAKGYEFIKVGETDRKALEAEEQSVKCERCGWRPATHEESRLCDDCEALGAKAKERRDSRAPDRTSFTVTAKDKPEIQKGLATVKRIIDDLARRSGDSPEQAVFDGLINGYKGLMLLAVLKMLEDRDFAKWYGEGGRFDDYIQGVSNPKAPSEAEILSDLAKMVKRHGFDF